ncbi:MAG TPA: ABC transporter ATP-binding protein [Methylomirabilota bacterium]|jgi:predicted ABC-type transport system involved in lysophospholipase L1 biosynthesis ATPase subunit|nr:ABC transporter ATP-binding protein [Methylomirabilota bacterium]
MSEPMVSASRISKTYLLGKRSLEVLRGVDLELQRGDFVALRGASGAGKSTLLHLLGGLDTPTQGEICLRGVNLASLDRNALARLRNREVGFIFQAYYLLPELDALENVCLPARMARADLDKTEARARELLSRVGLSERMEHKPYELSGGEQQRVAIARSLINEPNLVLADEPTGNLDSHTGEEIINLLCALRTEKQTTLVVATHDAKVAARAQRVVQLVDGQIQFGEPPP